VKVTFKEDSHEYRIGGKVVPSVTQVLVSSGVIETRWMRESARQRGELVHMAVQYFAENDLDESSLAPEVKPYLKAFKRFVSDTGFQIKHSEKIVHSETYMYCGRIDLAGELSKRNVMIDIKTNHIPTWVNLQVAAYRRAGDECKLKTFAGFGLALKADGTYRLRECKDFVWDLKRFLDLLRQHGWKD
jgi:hypothetical protein